MRGIRDEDANGYYFNGQAFYSVSNWPEVPSSLIDAINAGELDGDPDLFFFHFGGRSGKFVMGPTSASGSHEVRTIPYQKLRIVPDIGPSYIGQWVVTTEEGTQYTFAAVETTTDWSFGMSPAQTPNYGQSFPLELAAHEDPLRRRRLDYVPLLALYGAACAPILRGAIPAARRHTELP